MPVTADHVPAATRCVVSVLRPADDRDWSVVAGEVDWDCWHTAEHIGDCLLSYAAQLAATPADRYVRFLASADKDATAAEVLEFAEAGGLILAAMVRTAPAGARAYHPTGVADPEGFAAMSCAEMLLHEHDIATGLGLALDPDRDICRAVLARLFPEAPGGADSWQTLLWAAGRASLPGQPRRSQWRWRGAPLGEGA